MALAETEAAPMAVILEVPVAEVTAVAVALAEAEVRM